MAQCFACKAELAVYAHRCPECGARVRRGMARSDAERRRARLCHLAALPGMLFFIFSYPAIGIFAFVPLNVIVPLFYRWRNPQSPAIRTHSTEALNFQALWTPTIAVLWLIAAFATPSYDEPWWSTAAYYVPDQPIIVEFPSSNNDATYQHPSTVVEFPRTGYDATQEQPAEQEEDEDDGSLWGLATMAFGLLSLTWFGGIALSIFLAYDLGNGGAGRYPLRLPVFRPG